MAKYHDELEYDFAVKLPGEDFGELWRRRRWRKLLNLIDHLPRDTYYHQAVSLDEEHAMLLAESGALDAVTEAWAPPMATYSPEVEMILMVVNELKSLRQTLVAVNSTTSTPEPKFLPGPKTAFDKIEAMRRERKHRDLVARVLPHKAGTIT